MCSWDSFVTNTIRVDASVCMCVCLLSLQVSIHLGNWQQVLNYYSKAEATQEMTEVRGVTSVNCMCIFSMVSKKICINLKILHSVCAALENFFCQFFSMILLILFLSWFRLARITPT